MQQFCEDTHRFFSGIHCGDHLVVIPNGKKFNKISKMADYLQQNEAAHFLVICIKQMELSTRNGVMPGETNCYVVSGTLNNHLSDSGMPTHELIAYYDELADNWIIDLVEKIGVQFMEYHFHCSEIHDIVNFSGEKSIPTLCAKACAKRAYEREKAIFSAELARAT